MTTREIKLNPSASAPSGGLSAARLMLQSSGGVRVAGNDNVTGGSPVRITSFSDIISTDTYARDTSSYAIELTVNGLVVAEFTGDTISPTNPYGYVLPVALVDGVAAFTMAALWRIPTSTWASATGGHQWLFAASDAANASGGSNASFRQYEDGSVQAVARRSAAGSSNTLTVPQLTSVGDWNAVAVVFDFTNDTLTIHDLLSAAPVPESTEITVGTSGAVSADCDEYRLGYLSTPATPNSVRFYGDLADFLHIPFAIGSLDVLALRAHTQARAATLAG